MPPSLITRIEEDLFKDFDKEEEQIFRKQKIKKNTELDDITNLYEKILKDLHKESINFGKTDYRSTHVPYDFYTLPKKLFKARSRTITEFSLTLNKFEKYYSHFFQTGWFLSALINNSQDKEFTIHINHLKRMSIDHIGYKNNGKTITINGNVGDSLGDQMKEGIIILNGNAEYLIGDNASGGFIHINGNFNGFGSGFKGKLYHKGHLFFTGENLK